MKHGDAAMYLAIVLMTLTNRSSWYGRRKLKTMVFGSWMLTGTTTLTLVKFPASRTWVWSTFTQLLALVVLGISELPSPVHLASARISISEDCSVSSVIANRLRKQSNCSDSEASSSSQSTSTVEAEDVETDLEDLEEHYYSNLRRYSATLERDRPKHYTTQQLNAQEWDFHGGRDGLERFLSLPATWPLARLMFPIRDLRKQMETLLQTYSF